MEGSGISAAVEIILAASLALSDSRLFVLLEMPESKETMSAPVPVPVVLDTMELLWVLGRLTVSEASSQEKPFALEEFQ